MKPAWLIAVIALPVIAAGVSCGVVYQDRRMLYAGLIGAALMVLVFPFAVVLGASIRRSPLAALRLADYLRKFFTRRK